MFNNWTNWQDWLFVAIPAVGALAAALALTTAWSLFKRTAEGIRRWYWRIRFLRIFGHWPLTKDPTRIKILQGIVAAVLSPLEETFRTLCKQEENLQREYREPTGKKGLEDQRKDLKTHKQVQKDLARAKKRFHAARDTAKAFGFTMPKPKEVGR